MAICGEQHHAAVLSPPKVRAMRYLYWVRGLRVDCLSKLYGVSYNAIYDAVKYVTWKSVQDNFTSDQITRRINRG